MDLTLPPARQLLVQSARTFLAQRCPPERVLAHMLDPQGSARDLWKAISALGWPGLLVPAELGGSGGSMLDVVALAEELGRACCPGPYIGSAVVATSALVAAGSGRARELLPALALGERVAAMAVLEESGRVAPEAIAMAAEAPGRLSGRKLFVADAHAATDVILLGRSVAGPTAVLLPLDRPGIEMAPLDSMTGEKLFELTFSGVEARAEDLLGAPGAGWTLLEPAFRAGALARSAEMVGAAGRVLELCVEHARGRVQGGRPVGAYQAIQHACADLFRDVESARWLTWEAAWKVAAGEPDAEVAAASAKAWAAEACLRAVRRGHQIMGAIGYCEEHPLHLFHKRILAASLDWGDAGAHLEAVARALGLVTE